MLRVQRQESGRERGLITKGVGTVITNIFEICENVYFVPKSRLKHSLLSRKKTKQNKTNHNSQWQMKVIKAPCLPSPVNRFWVLQCSRLGARCREVPSAASTWGTCTLDTVSRQATQISHSRRRIPVEAWWDPLISRCSWEQIWEVLSTRAASVKSESPPSAIGQIVSQTEAWCSGVQWEWMSLQQSTETSSEILCIQDPQRRSGDGYISDF